LKIFSDEVVLASKYMVSILNFKFSNVLKWKKKVYIKVVGCDQICNFIVEKIFI